jgi:hypothetical protein
VPGAQLPAQRVGGCRYFASNQSDQGSNRNDQYPALPGYNLNAGFLASCKGKIAALNHND